MQWVLWMIAVAILGLAAVAASGRLGALPGTVTDTPRPHVPTGVLTGADLRAALDLAVVAQTKRRKQGGARFDLTTRSHIDAGRVFRARNRKVHRPREKVVLGLAVLGERAYVGPVTVHHIPINRLALSEQSREDVSAPVVVLIGLHEVQHFGFYDVDANVDGVADYLRPGGLFEKALDSPVGVGNHHAELERIFDSAEHQRDHRALGAVKLDRARKVAVRERVP